MKSIFEEVYGTSPSVQQREFSEKELEIKDFSEEEMAFYETIFADFDDQVLAQKAREKGMTIDQYKRHRAKLIRNGVLAGVGVLGAGAIGYGIYKSGQKKKKIEKETKKQMDKVWKGTKTKPKHSPSIEELKTKAEGMLEKANKNKKSKSLKAKTPEELVKGIRTDKSGKVNQDDLRNALKSIKEMSPPKMPDDDNDEGLTLW